MNCLVKKFKTHDIDISESTVFYIRIRKDLHLANDMKKNKKIHLIRSDKGNTNTYMQIRNNLVPTITKMEIVH